jgi:8-oxo-dGTP pyrophosphatase MutT (NUDIX family)
MSQFGDVWKPAVTVTGILERDGRFLFVEELDAGRRVLNQPSGHLDPGESLLAACAREVLEETAHRFAPDALVGVYRYVRDRSTTYLNFAFAGRIEGVEHGRRLDAEIVQLHWLTRDELAARRAEHRSPLVQARLEDYLAGRRFALDLLSREFA